VSNTKNSSLRTRGEGSVLEETSIGAVEEDGRLEAVGQLDGATVGQVVLAEVDLVELLF